jgi:hypothetical protein
MRIFVFYEVQITVLKRWLPINLIRLYLSQMKMLISLFCLLYANASFSQTSADSVKAVVTKLFTAMKAADGKMLVECFADNAILQTVSTNKEGLNYVDRIFGPTDFLAQLSKIPKDSADERITFDVVKTDGPLAIVWTPYQFYYAGVFHHCGVNSFQLVRINGSWKIQYLIDTRKRVGCN